MSMLILVQGVWRTSVAFSFVINDFEDFLDRVRIGIEQCILLIRVGAFRFLGQTKKHLLWKAQLYFTQRWDMQENSLFGVERKQFDFPTLVDLPLEDAYDQMELLGFSLCSPFELLPKEWKNFGLKASVLPAQLGKTVEVLGYFITCKPTRTSKGDRMYFGNFIDAAGDFIDTAHFPVVGKDNMGWRGSGIYQIQGRVIEEMGV
jgi:DNA polymerase-3 subunit alpha